MAKWRIRGSALPFPSPSIKQRALVKQTNKQHSQQYFVPPNDVRRSFQTAKKKERNTKIEKTFAVRFARQHFPKTPKKVILMAGTTIFLAASAVKFVL